MNISACACKLCRYARKSSGLYERIKEPRQRPPVHAVTPNGLDCEQPEIPSEGGCKITQRTGFAFSLRRRCLQYSTVI